MLDPKKLLDELLGARVPGTQSTVREKGSQATRLAKDNPIATSALAAILLGTGAGRAITGSALKLGGLAAVAGLAYTAYKHYQNGGAPDGADGEPAVLPPPEDSSFNPALAPQGEDEFALTLVRAMIAAARADGHIDDKERQMIGERAQMAGYDADEADFLQGEIERPVDVDALVAAAETDAQRVELYTASRLAIEADTRAERGYLDMLAGRLRLPDALVDHIESTVSQMKA